MFTEILKIKPQMDDKDAAKVANKLSNRFKNVSKKFSKGLKDALKGTFIGMSFALINSLLNPLSAMEDRIKALLGQGEDARDLADRFGTSEGRVRQLQDLSKVAGVNPEKLTELMGQYATAIERGRDEVLDPTKENSASTDAISNFLNDSDMAESFFSFIESLKRADPDSRRKIEKEIFGNAQTGSIRRLIDSDKGQLAAQLGGVSIDQLDKSLKSLANLSDRERLNSTRLEQANLVRSANKINPSMIDAMNESRKREMLQEQKELGNFQQLKKAQEGLDEIKNSVSDLLRLVTIGVGHLGDLVKFIKESKIFKGLTSFLRI